MSDITSAAFLGAVGTRSPVLARISTVGPERGSADTARDPRGWGIKIYTSEGNQDWVFNNTVRSHDLRIVWHVTDTLSLYSSFEIQSSFLRSIELTKDILKPTFLIPPWYETSFSPLVILADGFYSSGSKSEHIRCMIWLINLSFHNNNQEGTHELMHLFSDRGTPASLRHTDAFSGHTYKFTKPVRNIFPQGIARNVLKLYRTDPLSTSKST